MHRQTVWAMASLSVNKGGLEKEGITCVSLGEWLAGVTCVTCVTCVSLGEWLAGVRNHGPYSVSREQEEQGGDGRSRRREGGGVEGRQRRRTKEEDKGVG